MSFSDISLLEPLNCVLIRISSGLPNSIISAFELRGNNYESMFFLTWILLICFFSDTGGYIFGKIIGGKKLSKISPNKTIAGCLGSIMFSFLPITIISYQTYFKTNLELNLNTLILSLIVSIICQLGDIFISYFNIEFYIMFRAKRNSF